MLASLLGMDSSPQVILENIPFFCPLQSVLADADDGNVVDPEKMEDSGRR
jgi:hypothetical protein